MSKEKESMYHEENGYDDQYRDDLESGAIRYLTEKQVSRLTSTPLRTLRNNRYLRKGLPFYKIGGSVKYSVKDIEEYMQSHKTETT